MDFFSLDFCAFVILKKFINFFQFFFSSSCLSELIFHDSALGIVKEFL